ncbi:MAG: hypothetical protein QXM75_01575 [Candidatus Diapherotrites archaeon]
MKIQKLNSIAKLSIIFFLFLVILSAIALFYLAFLENEKPHKENIWQNMDIENLKKPEVLDMTPEEKQRVIVEIESILSRAKTLRDASSSMMQEYWNLNVQFGEFLKKKIEILQSYQAKIINERPSFEFISSTVTDCNYYLSLSNLSDGLKNLMLRSKNHNKNLLEFASRYGDRARDLNIKALYLDEQGFEKIAIRAEAYYLIGKECLLYHKSKEMFEKLQIDRLDCNNTGVLYAKIEQIESLVLEAAKLLDKLEALDANIEDLYEKHSSMLTALSELKRLYYDMNVC